MIRHFDVSKVREVVTVTHSMLSYFLSLLKEPIRNF